MFRLEKEDKGIKDRIIRHISNLSEHEENYHKQLIVSNLLSNSYIEYKSEGDRKALSVEEYPNKIKSYLKDIKNGHKKLATRKIQLTTKVNFISSKEDNDEDCKMQLKSDV